MKDRYKNLISISITLVFLYFSLKGIKVGLMWKSIKTSNWILFVFILFLTLLTIYFRCWRLKFIIRSSADVKLYDIWSAYVIGFMVNNVWPARIGEFARAYVITKKTKYKFSHILATLVVERIFDGIAILFLFMLVILIYPIPPWLKRISLLATIFYFLVAFVFFGLNIKREKTLSLIFKIFFFIPIKWKEKFIEIVNSFSLGLAIFKDKKNLILSLISSIICWFFIALMAYLSFFLFPNNPINNVPFYGSIVLVTTIAFITMIPAAPGNVGTTQLAFIWALSIFSIDKTMALSQSIIFHASQYFPITLAGFIHLYIDKISFGSLKKLKDGG